MPVGVAMTMPSTPPCRSCVAVLGPRHAHLCRQLPRPRRVGVDDYELVHLGQRAQCLGVQGPDAADPDHPDPHGALSFWVALLADIIALAGGCPAEP